MEDTSTPMGNVVSTHCSVDTDQSSDRSTRRFQNRVLIFVNKAPILWYSKQQSTVETSTFLSEFIALNTATILVNTFQ